MSKNLSKSDLIAVLAESLGLSESIAEEGINQIVDLIIEKLTAYQTITLTGFDVPINIKQTSGRDRLRMGSEVTGPGPSEKKLSTVLMKSKPGQEKRKLQRRNFILDIEVVDHATNRTLGDLGDITTEGIMIVSDDPISEDTMFSLFIRLPEEADDSLDIVFKARSIRCQETIHENIYLTGFLIDSLDEENKHKIEHLINEYAV